NPCTISIQPLDFPTHGLSDAPTSSVACARLMANVCLLNTKKGETMLKRLTLLIAVVFALTCFACSQAKPSPPASASYDLGGCKSVKTDYSSPRMKGRKIFGGLVPFGEVWRLGANEATTFVTSADVTVGGKAVPAGSYTLFAVPNADKWSLIINKKTGEWG